MKKPVFLKMFLVFATNLWFKVFPKKTNRSFGDEIVIDDSKDGFGECFGVDEILRHKVIDSFEDILMNSKSWTEFVGGAYKKWALKMNPSQKAWLLLTIGDFMRFQKTMMEKHSHNPLADLMAKLEGLKGAMGGGHGIVPPFPGMF